jgi:hypothetical protein
MTNDEIRDLLLYFLNDRHSKARSVKGQEIGIRDLQAALRQSHGLTQQQVSSNLDYLVQKGWVQRVVADRTFTTKYGTTQSAERVTYKVSAEGIDRIEGESKFKRPDPYSGIKIENIGGVTVVGDGNVVRTQFAPVAEALSELRRAVNASDLPDDHKLAVATEIQAIDLQLAKEDPDPTVIEKAWGTIKAAATVGTLLDLATRAGIALAPFISSAVTR